MTASNEESTGALATAKLELSALRRKAVHSIIMIYNLACCDLSDRCGGQEKLSSDRTP
jgi:hypothetical protein